MRTLSWPSVWRRRLERHALLEPLTSIPDVVRATCGIHAQVPASADLSIGLRTSGVTRSDVHKALWADRTLVRTYGVRGTVHLYAADDLPLWLAAFQAKAPPREEEGSRLPSDKLRAIIDAIADALDGRYLDRTELAASLEARLGPWVTHKSMPGFNTLLPPWHFALAPAAAAGVLLFGPSRGTRVTYVRTDQWLGTLPTIDGQQALLEVARRFVRAYGPTTPAELARWFYTSPSAARALFQQLGDELEQVDVEGWRAWQLCEDPTPEAHPRVVHLLPYFDCYVVGAFPRDQLIPPHAPPVLRATGTAAPFAVLLIDGVVGGLWTRARSGRRFDVRVGAFSELTAEERAQVERQAARVGEILEAPIELSYGQVEARGHW